jgi:hypothetical protein
VGTLITTLVERLRRMSLDRGVFGSSKTWGAVAAVIYLGRLLGWMRRREEETVAIEALKPGESLLIRALPAAQARTELAAERAALRHAAELAKAAAKADRRAGRGRRGRRSRSG